MEMTGTDKNVEILVASTGLDKTKLVHTMDHRHAITCNTIAENIVSHMLHRYRNMGRIASRSLLHVNKV